MTFMSFSVCFKRAVKRYFDESTQGMLQIYLVYKRAWVIIYFIHKGGGGRQAPSGGI